MKLLSRKYSQNNYERFCEMADYLQVSRTALAYRMEQLGLLERNRLIEEAQALMDRAGEVIAHVRLQISIVEKRAERRNDHELLKRLNRCHAALKDGPEAFLNDEVPM